MPTNCCIRVCRNRSGRDVVKFHRFPKDPELRRKWIEILNLNCIPTHHRVCSYHFSPNSLDPSGRIKPNCLPIKPVTSTKVQNISIPQDHNYCKKELPSPTTERGNSSMESPRNNLRTELFDVTNSNKLHIFDETQIPCIEINKVQNENLNDRIKMRKQIKHEVFGTQIIQKLKKPI